MGAGKVSVKINSMGDNLEVYNAFKEIVSGAKVLDGDLRLNDGTLEKINFGGKARRFFNKNADSVSTEAENCKVRQAFFDSAQAYIKSCNASDEAKAAMLALLEDELKSDSSKNVPLSRRTVRMIVDAIDAMIGQKADEAKAADSLTISGRFGDFTLTKTQYTAMFKQTLIQLGKDPNVTAEQLRAYENQVDSYLAAFAKNGSLGNLGVFFMGSMDMKSVIDKMTGFFNKGVLPPRVGKGKAIVDVLSSAMVTELNNLRVMRMTKGDNALANKVDITRLHPANAADFQKLDQEQGVPPQKEMIKPAELPPAAKLVADLIFNDNLLEMQECQFNDGERIIQALSKNFTAFKALCQEVEEYDRDGEKSLLNLTEKSDFFKYLNHVCQFDDIKDKLVQNVLELVRRANKEISDGKPFDPNVNRGALYAHCEALYDIARDLNIEGEIDGALKKAATGVSKAIVDTLKGSISGESSQKAVDELEKSNDKLLGAVLSKSKYFESANSISLRRMFASALRQSTMSIDDQLDNDKGGGHIDYGAFLMGSGPYMLKLLQGLDIGRQIENAGGELKPVQSQIFSGVNRIKSQMPGLDVDTIYAHLLALGGTNESMFKSVELQRELGAASVGVTYACKVTFGDGEKKDVVLKMLRPGVEGQLNEEIGLMQEAGKKIGLEREVALTTESIKRELNLNKEFTALTKGREIYSNTKEFRSEYEIYGEKKVYVRQADQVDSVKPVLRDGNQVEATNDCMIMERAPGVSVANYFETIKAEAKNGFGLNELESLEAVQGVVATKRGQLEKLHSATLQVAAKLLDGLFPKDADKEGYFHGDLHAGNMMYDEKSGKITLIDYGKGTWLKPAQSDAIRKLLAIASVGGDISNCAVAEALVDVYEQIMRAEKNNEGFTLEPKVRNKLMDAFVEMAKKELGKGIEMLANFGHTAMKSGVDLPLVFFDFFSTCGKLGSEIRQVENAMSELDKAYVKCDKFRDECKSMAEELSGAFDNSLFRVNEQESVAHDPGFDNKSVVGLAISVMTQGLKKVELDGLSSTLKGSKASDFDFGNGIKLNRKDLIPPEDADRKSTSVYQINFGEGNDRFNFVKNEMCGILESVAEFNTKMSDESGIGFANSLRPLAKQLKGSVAAFRKIIASRKVKSIPPEDGQAALETIASDYKFAHDKLTDLNDKIEIMTNAIDDLDKILSSINDKDWSVEGNEDNLVEVLKYMAMTGSTCRAKVYGNSNDLLDWAKNGDVDALKNYITKIKYENGDTPKKYWQKLAADVQQEFEWQISDWQKLETALGGVTVDKMKGGVNGARIEESRKLIESPDTVIENGLLKKIDDVVSRFDALYSTINSDFSVGRTDYKGDIDEKLERSFHLYAAKNELSEGEIEIVSTLYSDETGGDGKINMNKGLNKEECGEYTALFNHLKPICGEMLKAEKLPDPKEQLTRQDLSKLYHFADYLTDVTLSSNDPVAAMMQSSIGKLFAGGVGKDTDSGVIKVVMNRFDKIGKVKHDDDQAKLLKDLETFVGKCGKLELSMIAEVNQETLDDCISELSKLKARDNGAGLADLEIEQIKQESKSESGYRLEQWLGKQNNLPKDKATGKPVVDVAKMTEMIHSALKKELGEASLEKVKAAGLPEEFLVCAFLRGLDDADLVKMVEKLNGV